MNRTLSLLTNAPDVGAFKSELNSLKDSLGAKELSKRLGIKYTQLYGILTSGTASVRTLVIIAGALARETGAEKDQLVSLFCNFFNRDIPSLEKITQIETSIEIDESADSEQPIRPAYVRAAWLAGNVIVTYSKDDEDADIAAILKARKNPENGLARALSRYWWLQQVPSCKELGYTREEALKLEASHRMNKLKEADSLDWLVSFFGELDVSFIPEMPSLHRDGNRCSTWEHEKDRHKVTTEEKLTALGQTTASMRALFFREVLRIAKDLQKKIELTHESEKADDKFSELRKCVEHIPAGWASLEVLPSAIHGMTEKSMMLEAKRHAARLEAAETPEPQRLGFLWKIMEINKAWGIPLEIIGVTPKTIARCIAKESLVLMKERVPHLFELPAVTSEIELLFAKE